MDYKKIKPEEAIIFETYAMKNKTINVRCENDIHRQECLDYQQRALAMPYHEIVDLLKQYDESSPKMDEIKFVHSIQVKYNQSEDNVLRRIRDVRNFSKILTKVKVNGFNA